MVCLLTFKIQIEQRFKYIYSLSSQGHTTSNTQMSVSFLILLCLDDTLKDWKYYKIKNHHLK